MCRNLQRKQTRTLYENKKNLEKHKNNEKNRRNTKHIKIIKSQTQPKNLKRIITSSTFGENTTQGVTICNNKRCKICDIITEGKSYTFKKPENKILNKRFNLQLKKCSLLN